MYFVQFGYILIEQAEFLICAPKITQTVLHVHVVKKNASFKPHYPILTKTNF